MYAVYIMRRTQIYLGDHQDRLLDERAGSLGTTKSAVIRDAIDAFLLRDDSHTSAIRRLRAAVAEATGAASHLPTGADYVDEIRARDADRDQDLADRLAS